MRTVIIYLMPAKEKRTRASGSHPRDKLPHNKVNMKKLALFFGLLASAMANAQGLESLMAVYKDGVFMIDLDTNSLPRFKGFNGFTQANLKENRDSTGGNYFPVYHFTSRYDGKKWRSEERRVGKECRSRWS